MIHKHLTNRPNNGATGGSYPMKPCRRIEPGKAFRIIYTPPNNPSKAISQRILATAEEIGMKLFKPNLCAHKQFAQTLSLPWPDIQTYTTVHNSGDAVRSSR